MFGCQHHENVIWWEANNGWQEVSHCSHRLEEGKSGHADVSRLWGQCCCLFFCNICSHCVWTRRHVHSFLAAKLPIQNSCCLSAMDMNKCDVKLCHRVNAGGWNATQPRTLCNYGDVNMFINSWRLTHLRSWVNHYIYLWRLNFLLHAKAWLWTFSSYG